MKGFVHDLKPFHTVQRIGFHAQHLEIIENIGFDTLQPGLCFPNAFCFDAERDVLRPNQTVVTLGKLLFQHLCIFHTHIVKRVVLRLDLDYLVVLAHIALVVDERQLKADTGIEVVEEVAPAFKDGVLILVLCQLVVNVVESDGFGINGGIATDNAGGRIYHRLPNVKYRHCNIERMTDEIDRDPHLHEILEEHPSVYIVQIVPFRQHRDQFVAEDDVHLHSNIYQTL